MIEENYDPQSEMDDDNKLFNITLAFIAGLLTGFIVGVSI